MHPSLVQLKTSLQTLKTLQCDLTMTSLTGFLFWLCHRACRISVPQPGNEPGTQGSNRRRGFNPWKGRSPGGANANPLQYFCLENPMDRGAWRATVHADTKSWTQLSVRAHTHTHTHPHSSKGLSPNHWSPRGLSGQVCFFPGSLPWSPYVLLLTQVLHIQARPPPNTSQHTALCSRLPPWSSPAPSAFRRLRGD